MDWGLWQTLACLGCPPKCLTILCRLHEGQQGQVKYNGSLSGSFPISNIELQATAHPGPHHVLHLLQHYALYSKQGPARWHFRLAISLKKTEVLCQPPP